MNKQYFVFYIISLNYVRSTPSSRKISKNPLGFALFISFIEPNFPLQRFYFLNEKDRYWSDGNTKGEVEHPHLIIRFIKKFPPWLVKRKKLWDSLIDTVKYSKVFKNIEIFKIQSTAVFVWKTYLVICICRVWLWTFCRKRWKDSNLNCIRIQMLNCEAVFALSFATRMQFQISLHVLRDVARNFGQCNCVVSTVQRGNSKALKFERHERPSWSESSCNFNL